MKSPLETPSVTAFLANDNLCRSWTEFRSAIAARMHLFPDALYPEMAMFEVARFQESKGHESYIKREGRKQKNPYSKFEVWSSVKGSHIYGEVRSHLVNPGTGRTFCGKPKGRMTTRFTHFNPKEDCQRCTQAVDALLRRKGGAVSTPDYDEAPKGNTPED